MSDSIIVALITGAVTICVQIFINLRTNARDEVTRAVREQKLDDRLLSIEGKLDEHNGYAKKFAEVSTAITKIEKDIEYLKERKKE